MKSAPMMPASRLKNSLPTAFFLPECSISFIAFSSVYTPSPMDDKKLKKILTPQVTGLVASSPCRYCVMASVRAIPRGCAVSDTSLPIEYMITLGWL